MLLLVGARWLRMLAPRPRGRLLILTRFVGGRISLVSTSEHRSYPTWSTELWLVPMPLGPELDVQQIRGSRRAVWRTP